MPSKSKQERRLARRGADALAEKQSMAFAEICESPLPPPAELERYEKMLPGATKLLFNNLIDQTNHRMQLENKIVNTDGKKAILGQVLAFILGMTALVSGTILILNIPSLQQRQPPKQACRAGMLSRILSINKVYLKKTAEFHKFRLTNIKSHFIIYKDGIYGE